MTEKQMDSKKATKALARKVAPLVMSTSMMAATFLVAGAPISAAELEEKGVNPEVLEQVKNHGQEVSELAKYLPGSPEKGKHVSDLAKNKSFKLNPSDKTDDPINEPNDDESQIDEGSEEEAGTEEEAIAEEDSEVPAETPEESADENSEVPAETPEDPADETGEGSEEEAGTEEEAVAEEDSEVPAETPEDPADETGEGSEEEAGTEEEAVAEEDSEVPAETPEESADEAGEGSEEETGTEEEAVAEEDSDVPAETPEESADEAGEGSEEETGTEEEAVAEEDSDVPAETPEESADEAGEGSEEEAGTEEEAVAEEDSDVPAETPEESAGEDDSVGTNQGENAWEDETYQLIGANYQSLIGYYQSLIDQYFIQADSEQTNDEFETITVDLLDESVDIDEANGTLEAGVAAEATVDPAAIHVTNHSQVNAENEVLMGETQPAEQETVEQDEHTDSTLTDSVQPVNEETNLDVEVEQENQNEQDNVQSDKTENDQVNQTTIKDKLVGYYQDLVTSFSNFMNFLK
ncbi:hypothetical protein [Bacillus sp. B15-48]|uniref:hypothetical protein n=1 Tax=Bacillus sp. B15-48 TaxID=1548601 RepID=UPI00193EC8C2|nr:hypothetical protein [Bacillus sp. B15-48]MBM4761144.1 hypothetical protein [Bacillus sp. B15-48]